MTTQSTANNESVNRFGFWLYLMTDSMIFATLFATYAVLMGGTNGGPDGKELFDLPFVLIETIILLVSSVLSGIMLLAVRHGKQALAIRLLASVILLGVAFMGMELYEFGKLASEGHDWQASAFLSSFFTLVATHGMHVTIGILWASVLLVHIIRDGISTQHARKAGLFTIFWHFLDVVWVFIFTFVYMFGGIL